MLSAALHREIEAEQRSASVSKLDLIMDALGQTLAQQAPQTREQNEHPATTDPLDTASKAGAGMFPLLGN